MNTGTIEVHIEEITRVQAVPQRPSAILATKATGKRSYSTMVSGKSHTATQKAITSVEYKKCCDSDNIHQHFINRHHTCGSLRLFDVDKIVSLVGWIESKLNHGKFVQLCDGYGETQILVESDRLKSMLERVTDKDVVMVTGRVCARPKSNQFHMANTGEIELYCSDVVILNPTDTYGGMVETEVRNTIGIDSDQEFIQLTTPTNASLSVNSFTFRTHNCGELNATDVGQKVTLCGWFEFQRMKKFFTLRDGYGRTQVIVPEKVT